MTKKIKVLLVDDKQDYCESLSGVARLKNIQIIYKLDWENGFEKLKEDSQIEFVILDGKGKIEEDQQVEKDNFVLKAIRDIDIYTVEKNRYIPYCVNTGYMDRFDELLEGNIRIFEKSNQEREIMFDYIIEEVKKSNYRTARSQFKEAFLSFDKNIVSKKYEQILINIILAYCNNDFRKVNLNLERDFLEGLFISMNSEIPCIPEGLFKNDGLPNLEWCTRFLENRPTKDGSQVEHTLKKQIPQSIKSAFRKIKESTSEFSHLTDETLVKTPFLANMFLIMEILEWLPEFVEEHYPNYI